MKIVEDALIARLPESYRTDVARYVYFGSPPPPYLSSIIENDLAETMISIDNETFRITTLNDLRALTMYFVTDAPAACAGGREIRIDWQNAGGIFGQEDRRKALR